MSELIIAAPSARPASPRFAIGVAVHDRRGRGGLARDAEQDRGDVAGGVRHREHAQEEGERLDRAHLEDERQHQRERGGAAEARAGCRRRSRSPMPISISPNVGQATTWTSPVEPGVKEIGYRSSSRSFATDRRVQAEQLVDGLFEPLPHDGVDVEPAPAGIGSELRSISVSTNAVRRIRTRSGGVPGGSA